MDSIAGRVIYTKQGKNLTSVPSDVPLNVQVLDLSNNLITQLVQVDLNQLTDLEELYVSSNVIERLGDNFVSPLVHKNLSVLSMGDNLIKSMPNLEGFLKLRLLNISGNHLQEVYLGQLEGLQEIHADRNILSSMPNLTTELPTLTKLYLHENKISTVTSGYFAKLPALEELDLTSNLLKQLTIGQLDNLEILSLMDNDLTSMPTFTHVMPELNSLLLYKNSISSIPSDYFLKTPSLKTLNLNKTPIVEFNCSGLQNLKYLYLDKTNIYSFPNITDCFLSLVSFYMQNNAHKITVTGIDKSMVFGSSLQEKVSTSMRKIYLRNSHFHHVPDWFLRAVPKVTHLDFAQMMLSDMPDISENIK